MADFLTKEARSALMARIRSSGTGPERTAERMARSLGARPVLNDRRLPGTPDMAFHGRRLAVFVHGCFWHRHGCPAGRRSPAVNRAFWEAKFEANARRDRRAVGALRRAGWRTMTVWECQLRRGPEAARRRLARALGRGNG